MLKNVIMLSFVKKNSFGIYVQLNKEKKTILRCCTEDQYKMKNDVNRENQDNICKKKKSD